MKCCSVCKQDLPYSAFVASAYAKDGHKSACRTCEAARHREYYRRQLASRGPRNRGTGRPVEVPWPLPAHDIQQSLACVQFLKWRGPVNREPMRAIL